MTKDEVIRKFDMVPLVPEGGYVKELYRGKSVNGRPIYGTIYYMLVPGCVSHMHKLDADEIWFFHDGNSVELYLIYDDHDEIRYLGKDLDSNEELQIRVPAGAYMGARMKDEGEYSLVSTCMAPAYTQKGFVLGTYEELINRSTHPELLMILTN